MLMVVYMLVNMKMVRDMDVVNGLTQILLSVMAECGKMANQCEMKKNVKECKKNVKYIYIYTFVFL